MTRDETGRHKEHRVRSRKHEQQSDDTKRQTRRTKKVQSRARECYDRCPGLNHCPTFTLIFGARHAALNALRTIMTPLGRREGLTSPSRSPLIIPMLMFNGDIGSGITLARLERELCPGLRSAELAVVPVADPDVVLRIILAAVLARPDIVNTDVRDEAARSSTSGGSPDTYLVRLPGLNPH